MISFNEGTQVSNYDYISVPFSSIDDSLVNISSKEVKKYYNENKDDYKQDLSRDIDYVVFSVVPTLDDDNATKESINNLVNDFGNYDDYLTMVRRNSDNTRVLFSFQSAEKLNSDSAFSALISEEKNTVIGPYKINPSTYRISKLIDIQRFSTNITLKLINSYFLLRKNLYQYLVYLRKNILWKRSFLYFL